MVMKMTYRLTHRQMAELEQLRNFHGIYCDKLDWVAKAKEPFPKNGIGPNELIWKDRMESYSPKHIEKYLFLDHVKRFIWNRKQLLGKKRDDRLYQEWEKENPLVQKVLSGDEDVWRKIVRTHCTFLDHRVAKGYSLHKYSLAAVECDVYLYAMDEIIPSKLEKATKKGSIRYHDMPATKRLELYESYIFSSLSKIADDLFKVLPCDTLYLNGLTEDRGDYKPILSSVLSRKTTLRYACFKKKFQNQRLMVEFKKRSGFSPINRVYSPDILN